MGGHLKRMIVESLAERGIQKVREDPQRSIRQLVDIGRQSAKGRFQQDFFRLGEHLLADEESPYYLLLRSLAKCVDPLRLKTFGVNLGWQSLTVGANQIRTIEGETGIQIPWCLVFHLGSTKGPLSPEVLERLLAEGEELGIYTVLLDGEGADDLTPYVTAICKRKDTAFLLLLTPEQVKRYEKELLVSTNLLVLVSADQDGWEEASDLLHSDQMLFGCSLRYSGAPPMLEPAFFDRLAAHGGTTLFLMAEPSASPELVEEVSQSVHAFRHHPSAPLFLVDFYSDHHYVDEIVSDTAGLFGAAPDGTLLRCEGGREVPTGSVLGSSSLRELLAEEAQRVHSAPSESA